MVEPRSLSQHSDALASELACLPALQEVLLIARLVTRT
jgi:hypothetical protein